MVAIANDLSGVRSCVDHEQRVQWCLSIAEFFEAIPTEEYQTPIPACEGWVVEDVVRHVGASGVMFRRMCEPNPPPHVGGVR